MRFTAVLLTICPSFAFAQGPTIGAVVNQYSYNADLSPGVLASIFGNDLSGNNLDVKLNGISCPVTYSSALQLNIQVPWETSLGSGQVVVSHDGLISNPLAVTMRKYSPELAAQNAAGSGLGIFLSGTKLITATNPANGGDTIAALAIGLGATSPAIADGAITPNPPPYYSTLATPNVTVGNRAATVLLSNLAPGLVATDQVTFTLAPNTPVGAAEAVMLKIGGIASPGPITIPIGCQDQTSKVSVVLGPLHQIPGGYYQKVTMTNTSGQQLNPNGSLVLTALSGATLLGGGGAACPSSDGSAFKSFKFSGTGSAQTATSTLKFAATSTNINYVTRILVK